MEDDDLTVDTVADALLLTEDFLPEEVADALPGFKIPHHVQAGLLHTWDRSFADKVLLTWTPPTDTWVEFLKSSKHDVSSLSLMSTKLEGVGIRRAISAAARGSGGPRLAQLMKALRVAQSEPSGFDPGSVLNPPPTLPASANSGVNIISSSPAEPSNPVKATLPPNAPRLPVARNSTSEGRSVSPQEARKSKPRGTSPQPGAKLKSASTPTSNSQHDPVRRPPSPSTTISEELSGANHHKEPRQQRRRQHTPAPDSNDEDISLIEPAPSRQQEPKSFTVKDLNLLGGVPDTDSVCGEREGDEEEDLAIEDDAAGSENQEDPWRTGGAGANDADDADDDDDDDDDDGDGNQSDEELVDGAGEDQMGPDTAADGYTEPSLNPWAWSQKANDLKVAQWGLEDLIGDDHRSTAAARTEWMYEARLGNMSEEDYEKRREAETSAFMEIPLACRDAVGLVFYKDSKLDWEIRVFLAPAMYKYVLSKVDEEEAVNQGDDTKAKTLKEERAELLDKTMKELFERFPDCHPDHPLRQIKKHYGPKIEAKFLTSFRNKFTSDAGRMKTSYLKSAGKVGQVATRTSASTLLEILGRKRAHIAFHLWGGSESGGKTLCEAEIEKQMAEWRKKNHKLKPSLISRHRITVVHSVRCVLFKQQSEDVQELWSKRAKALHIPKTPEEEQCLVDAALPYIVELLSLLSERADMHFVLLASARGSCNIPIVLQEFMREKPESKTFISMTEGLGSRLKSEYIAYSVKKYGGDVNEAVVGVPGVDFKMDDEEEGEATTPNQDLGKAPVGKLQKGGAPQPTYVPPFKPDLATVKKVPQMAKAISDWILSALEKIHGTRPIWDKVTKYAHTYIDAERMPMDPDHPTQRLQLQKPSAMSDPRITALFTFLVNSYNGVLPASQRFRLKHEARHLNMPSPAVPDDPSVHYAAAVAAKTKVPPRQRTNPAPKEGKGKRSKGALEPPSEDDEFHDLAGLRVEEDAAALDQALDLTAGKPSGPKTRKSVKLRVESPPPESDEATGSRTKQVYTEETSSTHSMTERTQLPKARPRPKSILNPATDELSHHRFIPGVVNDATLWSQTRASLAEWGENMTFSDGQSRTMPCRYLSGIKPDVELPSGLNAAFSILQIWNAYQASSDSDATSTIKVNALQGLEKLHRSHHVSVAIGLISDIRRTLPSAKHIYDQILFGEEAACALFLHLESAVSDFIDRMVSSEDAILSANIDLLEGFRLAAFVGATGFIRDIGKTRTNTVRTSAITDRFVSVLAAIAFVRYLSVILVRVARLYCEDAHHDDLKLMWEQVIAFYNIGCQSLARALVKRRSDTFMLEHLAPLLPKNFLPLLDYLFTDRPWWTPGNTGAPGPVKIVNNKQAVATEALFKLIQSLTWSQLSFIERGNVMLLVLLAAIQVQNGRVTTNPSNPISAQLAKSLEALVLLIKGTFYSDEVGPIADPISIPMELAAPSLASWAVESQKAFEAEKVPPNTGVDGEPLATSKPQLKANHAASTLLTAETGHVSSVSTASFLPPEDEDPIFHSGHPQIAYPPSVDSVYVNTNHDVPPDPIPAFQFHKPEDAPIPRPQTDAPPDTIPAVRKLDEAPIPSPKKRKLRELHLQPDQALLPAGQTLRSTAKASMDPSNSPLTPVEAEGSTSVARGKGGKAAAGTGKGRGRQAGASTRSSTALTTASKRGGKGRGRGRGKAT